MHSCAFAPKKPSKFFVLTTVKVKISSSYSSALKYRDTNFFKRWSAARLQSYSRGTKCHPARRPQFLKVLLSNIFLLGSFSPLSLQITFWSFFVRACKKRVHEAISLKAHKKEFLHSSTKRSQNKTKTTRKKVANEFRKTHELKTGENKTHTHHISSFSWGNLLNVFLRRFFFFFASSSTRRP